MPPKKGGHSTNPAAMRKKFQQKLKEKHRPLKNMTEQRKITDLQALQSQEKSKKSSHTPVAQVEAKTMPNVTLTVLPKVVGEVTVDLHKSNEVDEAKVKNLAEKSLTEELNLLLRSMGPQAGNRLELLRSALEHARVAKTGFATHPKNDAKHKKACELEFTILTVITSLDSEQAQQIEKPQKLASSVLDEITKLNAVAEPQQEGNKKKRKKKKIKSKIAKTPVTIVPTKAEREKADKEAELCEKIKSWEREITKKIETGVDFDKAENLIQKALHEISRVTNLDFKAEFSAKFAAHKKSIEKNQRVKKAEDLLYTAGIFLGKNDFAQAEKFYFEAKGVAGDLFPDKHPVCDVFIAEGNKVKNFVDLVVKANGLFEDICHDKNLDVNKLVQVRVAYETALKFVTEIKNRNPLVIENLNHINQQLKEIDNQEKNIKAELDKEIQLEKHLVNSDKLLKYNNLELALPAFEKAETTALGLQWHNNAKVKLLLDHAQKGLALVLEKISEQEKINKFVLVTAKAFGLYKQECQKNILSQKYAPVREAYATAQKLAAEIKDQTNKSVAMNLVHIKNQFLEISKQETVVGDAVQHHLATRPLSTALDILSEINRLCSKESKAEITPEFLVTLHKRMDKLQSISHKDFAESKECRGLIPKVLTNPRALKALVCLPRLLGLIFPEIIRNTNQQEAAGTGKVLDKMFEILEGSKLNDYYHASALILAAVDLPNIKFMDPDKTPNIIFETIFTSPDCQTVRLLLLCDEITDDLKDMLSKYWHAPNPEHEANDPKIDWKDKLLDYCKFRFFKYFTSFVKILQPLKYAQKFTPPAVSVDTQVSVKQEQSWLVFAHPANMMAGYQPLYLVQTPNPVQGANTTSSYQYRP